MVSGFQGSRNNLTVYGVTPLDSSDYSHPLDFFEKLLEYMMDLESLISEGIELSMHDDAITFSFLLGFIKQVSNVTNQCLLLVDKAELYKDDCKSFDERIESFVIL